LGIRSSAEGKSEVEQALNQVLFGSALPVRS
jgi:hypothetical protein